MLLIRYLMLFCMLGFATAQHQYRYQLYSAIYGVNSRAGQAIKAGILSATQSIIAKIVMQGADDTYTASSTNDGYSITLTYTPFYGLGQTFSLDDFKTPALTLANTRNSFLEYGSHGISFILSASQCVIGQVDYDVFDRTELKKRETMSDIHTKTDVCNASAERACDNTSNELKYIKNATDHGQIYVGFHKGLDHPYNQTSYAVPKTSPSPSNGPICKRSDLGDMVKCIGGDTLLAGQKICEGTSLYSKMATARLFIEKDGNLCLYDMNGKNYWCANEYTKGNSPNCLALKMDGTLCVGDSKEWAWCWNVPNNTPGRYRLTIQNDGNLVLYDGNGVALTASNSNIFNQYSSPPCNNPGH